MLQQQEEKTRKIFLVFFKKICFYKKSYIIIQNIMLYYILNKKNMRKIFVKLYVIVFIFCFYNNTYAETYNEGDYWRLITSVSPTGENLNLVDSVNNYTIEKVNIDSEEFWKNENWNFWWWSSPSNNWWGFRLKIPNSEKFDEEYTIAVKFQYEKVDGSWRKIIDYKNKWSDNWFYFSNKKIVFYEGWNKWQQINTFENNQLVDLIVTRFPDGRFVVYSIKAIDWRIQIEKELDLNLSLNSTIFSKDAENNSIVWFFFDDTNWEFTPAWKFYSLKIWNKAISEEVIRRDLEKIISVEKSTPAVVDNREEEANKALNNAKAEPIEEKIREAEEKINLLEEWEVKENLKWELEKLKKEKEAREKLEEAKNNIKDNTIEEKIREAEEKINLLEEWEVKENLKWELEKLKKEKEAREKLGSASSPESLVLNNDSRVKGVNENLNNSNKNFEISKDENLSLKWQKQDFKGENGDKKEIKNVEEKLVKAKEEENILVKEKYFWDSLKNNGKEFNSEIKIKEISSNNSCPIILSIISDFNIDYKQKFSDLTVKNNLSEINILTKLWIVKWVTKTSFEPDREITRAEFLSILLQIHCYDVSKVPEKLPFYDVDLNSWQARVIKVANDLGIISGYKKDEKWISFKSDNEISKYEAIIIIKKMLELQNQDIDSNLLDFDWSLTRDSIVRKFVSIVRNYKQIKN